MRDGGPARRFALTGWCCIHCGARGPARNRPDPARPCCERMFAIRVTVIEPDHGQGQRAA